MWINVVMFLKVCSSYELELMNKINFHIKLSQCENFFNHKLCRKYEIVSSLPIYFNLSSSLGLHPLLTCNDAERKIE